MEDCIFCKIIKGEIPSFKIYEDEKTYAFLDIAKDFYGHTLVVPKNHCHNILDCSKEDLEAVMLTVQKISKHYTENCGYDSVNLFNINELVPHFHIHIIPRKTGDGIAVLNESNKIEDMNLEEIKKNLEIK